MDQPIAVTSAPPPVGDCVKGRWIRIVVVAVLLLGMYGQAFAKLARDLSVNENYSHGFFVPVVAAYLLFRDRARILALPVQPHGSGIALVLLGAALLVVGSLGNELFTQRMSFLVVLAGLLLSFGGRGLLAASSVPLAYLVLMIPLPYIVYDAVTFSLKLLVTASAAETLKLAGVVVLREGNILMLPGVSLEVADACSGLRSLMSLVALGTAIAFVSLRSARGRIVLLCAILPIAFFVNILRVTGTGILVQTYGVRFAEGALHEMLGIIMFAVAAVIMFAMSAWLGRREHAA